jgi:hypothetical protein
MKKRPVTLSMALATLLVLCAPAAQGLVVSESVFVAHGGNLNNIRGTITEANEELRARSLSAPYQAVGWIENCTATWIGDEGEWSYILTAAHCTNFDNGGSPEGEVFETFRTFRDYTGRITARGDGMAYIHEFRVERAEGHGGASTDIAILQLPKITEIVDEEGDPIPQPILYDLDFELGGVVEFTGYGLWGVGDQTLSGFNPRDGPRRLWGQSMITSIFEVEHGIGAIYVPNDADTEEPNPLWARVASGDSGSAWWQDHEGIKTIIATTNGGHATLSTGARVSRYVPWIRSIFPGARVFSEALFERDALVVVSDEAPGENCQEGGIRIEAGIDDNDDGALDEDEVDQVEYVCDDPPQGNNGEAPGEPDTLFEESDEPPGENCDEGGTVVRFGVDTNEDGALDESETRGEEFVCDHPIPGGTATDSGCSQASSPLSSSLPGAWAFVVYLLLVRRRLRHP